MFTEDRTLDIPKLTQSAAEGNATDQYALGIAYYKGIGVNINIAQAIDLLQQSANNGFASALTVLGDIFSDALYNENNAVTAEQFYLKAVECGEYDAAVELAEIYEREYLKNPSALLAKKINFLIDKAQETDALFAVNKLKKLLNN